MELLDKHKRFFTICEKLVSRLESLEDQEFDQSHTISYTTIKYIFNGLESNDLESGGKADFVSDVIASAELDDMVNYYNITHEEEYHVSINNIRRTDEAYAFGVRIKHRLEKYFRGNS